MIAFRQLPRPLVLALALTAAGCGFDDPCDPGQVEEHGLCFPGGTTMDASAADADDSDSGDTDASADPFAGFGTPCTLQSECAPYGLRCGEAFLPYCIQINCLGVANVCPPTWTCLDTRGASPDPNVTSVCLKP